MTYDNKKPSLKKRMNHLTMKINSYSLLIVMSAIIIILGILLRSFGDMISYNAGDGMSHQFEDQYNRVAAGNKSLGTYSENVSKYNEIFKNLGFPYVFLPTEIQKKDINKGIPIKGSSPINDQMLTIEYTIEENGKVVYDSENIPILKNIYISKIINALEVTNSTNLIDNSGNIHFKMFVKLNPLIIIYGYLGLITTFLLLFIITMLISRLIARVLINVLTWPLIDLDKRMNELANGNIEAAMKSEIKFRKPILEVERLANHTNVIISKMHDYISAMANQNSELEAQNETLIEASKKLESINNKLDNKNLKLKNLFDNVEQGILTFNKNLLIHDEYSLECERFFGKNISGQKLSNLIFSQNENSRKFMDELFEKIFDEEVYKRNIFFTLLPEELGINNFIVTLSYKIVKNEKNIDTIMVKITDITEKRSLEKQREEESNILKMVVKVIINIDDFRQLVTDYEKFFVDINKKIVEMKYDEVLRQLHTFKGNFSQYELINVVKHLDELENKIYENNEEKCISSFDFSKLTAWLQEDIEIIEKYAGKDFTKQNDFCYINKDKLIEIEKIIQKTLPANECKAILPMIQRLRYKSIKDALKIYTDYVEKLAERLEKNINTFEIVGDDIMLDTVLYNDVIKSIVHIFRNAADHGIETEDERIEKNKSSFGTISCEIKDNNDKFKIIISDDGRGIDLDRIKEKVLKDGLYTAEELNKMSENEIMSFIFEHGITTKESANFISGRGVGMSVVKEKVNELSGTIEISSKKDFGTRFEITLPKLDADENYALLPEKFCKDVALTAKEILKNQIGIDMIDSKISAGNSITLNKITALLTLKGSLNAIVMISINEAMGRRLVEGFMLQKVKEDDIINYIEGVLGEISNTILGYSFGKYENTSYFFHISIPAVLSNSDAYVKYMQSEILSCKLTNNECEFDISLLLLDDKTFIDFSEVKE